MIANKGARIGGLFVRPTECSPRALAMTTCHESDAKDVALLYEPELRELRDLLNEHLGDER